MLFNQIQELLNPGKDLPAPAEYEEAISDLERKLRVTKKEIGRLEAERPEMLLNATDEEVAELDSTTATKRRNAERIELALNTLRQHLETSETRARRIWADERIGEARSLQARGVKLVQRYGKLAGELTTLLRELEGIDVQITAINQEVRAAGLPERSVATADSAGRPGAVVPLYSEKTGERNGFGVHPNGQGGVQLPSAVGHGPMIRGIGPHIPRPMTDEEREEEKRRKAREYASSRKGQLEAWDREHPKPVKPNIELDYSNGEEEAFYHRDAPAYREWKKEHNAWVQERRTFADTLPR